MGARTGTTITSRHLDVSALLVLLALLAAMLALAPARAGAAEEGTRLVATDGFGIVLVDADLSNARSATAVPVDPGSVVLPSPTGEHVLVDDRVLRWDGTVMGLVPQGAVAPSWTTDGRRITYDRFDASAGDLERRSVALDGSDDRLEYVRRRGRSGPVVTARWVGPGGVEWEIAREAGGEGQVRPVGGEPTLSFSLFEDASVTPGGATVMLTSYSSDCAGTQGFALHDVESGQLLWRGRDAGVRAGPFVWSPDGSRLVSNSFVRLSRDATCQYTVRERNYLLDAADGSVLQRGFLSAYEMEVVGWVPAHPSQPATGRARATADGSCAVELTDGPDVRAAFSGDNSVCGLGGDDVLRGGPGDDLLRGNGGRDAIDGELGNDVVIGNEGDDLLVVHDGVRGNDRVWGGPGYDTCWIDPGDLTGNCEQVWEVDPFVEGYPGPERVCDADRRITQGGDTIPEGPIARELPTYLASPVARALPALGADLCLLGGDDTASGTPFTDRLRGDDGDDLLVGNGGADRLLGGPGDDVLDAIDGLANDYVYGGPGRDTCHVDPGDVVGSCEVVTFERR